MAGATGRATNFYLSDETTAYGAPDASPVAKKIYAKTVGLKLDRNQLNDDTLNGSRTQEAPEDGNTGVGGSIVVNANPFSMCFLLKHALGAPVTGGVGPYTHTYAIKDLPTGFDWENDFGSAIATTPIDQYVGNKMAGFSISKPAEGFVEVAFDVVGANMTPQAALLDVTPDDVGHRSFSAFHLQTLQQEGIDIADVKSLSFKLSNELDEDSFYLAGGGVRGDLDEGQAMVSGQMELAFKNRTLLALALGGTDITLATQLQFGAGDGTAGNESLQFNSGALRLKPTSAAVDGPKGLKISMDFTCSGVNALTAIVKNMMATI